MSHMDKGPINAGFSDSLYPKTPSMKLLELMTKHEDAIQELMKVRLQLDKALGHMHDLQEEIASTCESEGIKVYIAFEFYKKHKYTKPNNL